MIKFLKEILSPNMIQNIYFTKLQSHLQFGILFWGELGGELNMKILRIQKKSDKINGWNKFKNIL
jgi:hypothetical protein